MKRLITVLMMMILLAGCSGKKSEMKPAAPVPGVPSAKPADSDPYEKFYGTWRTRGLEIDGTRFNMEQLETLGYKEQCDLIFVLAKDGVVHGYVFYGDIHQELTWSKTDDKNVIDVNGAEFAYTDNEISFTVSDTTNAILSKVSDRQDKDIIDELIAKETKQDEAPQADPEPVPEEKEETVSQNTIRPEVKEAIDAYEAFIDEYCEFMVRYSESDGTDLKILADYAAFIGKLADYENKMDKMADDLTDAEYWYYVEVLNRCNEKIMKVAY